jgi:phosphate transport system protein
MLSGDRSEGEGHTFTPFDQAFSVLRLHALAMGGLVIDQVGSATQALLGGDRDLASRVVEREITVNRMARDIDRESFELIARHHPVAGDLRLAKAISRVIVDLERAGDEAKKIARFAARREPGAPSGPVAVVAAELKQMADLSSGMLRDAVRSLDEGDAVRARNVTARDAQLDREFEAALLHVLASSTGRDRAQLGIVVDTVFALKGLERIGDHAKNIGEQVLFVAEGDGDEP